MPRKAAAPKLTVPTIAKVLVDLEADQAPFLEALRQRAKLRALRSEWVSFRGEDYPLKLHENTIDLLDAANSDLGFLDHCIDLVGDGDKDFVERYRLQFKAALRSACEAPDFDPMPVLQRVRAVINQRPTMASVS